MQDPEISFLSPQMSRSGQPLILILIVEHDQTFGTGLVQLLQRETRFHAILATGIAEAHRILQHLHCDAIFLYHGSFSRDDLDRLDQLPPYAEMPPLTLLAGLPLAPDQPETWSLENLIKSIQCIRPVRNAFDKGR
jgi:hypothetical protein